MRCCALRARRGSQENIAEEIADVEIMIEQMKMLFKDRMEQNG